MTNYLLQPDAMHGAAGKAFITIDGHVKELFGAKKLQVQADINTTEMKVIGTKRIQNKPGSVKHSGTGTIYYGTPIFLDMLVKYVNEGIMPQFNLQITDYDPSSSAGRQTIICRGCNLSGTVPITVLDAEVELLTFDFSFVFDRLELLSRFNDRPTKLGASELGI